jgi:hypothetical protein
VIERLRPFLWPAVVVVFAICAWALLRHKRPEELLVDFVVPRTAALRVLNHEPLYRPEDGHYQYKYFPAFAFAMVPFTWLPKEPAEILWFALTFVMAWAFVRLSIRALPDRRSPIPRLVWLTLLLNGKFLVKEIGFGQFNLPLALLLIGAVIAAQRARPVLAGALVGLGVFVKPYALVLLPWLLWSEGVPALAAFSGVVAAGLLLPATAYGWNGNIALLHDWYRTVTDTTAPNLLAGENISFATMWVKWIGAGPIASALAAATAVASLAVGVVVLVKCRTVRAPDFLDASYFLVLIPLLSPQGWDYVLLLALPAYVCLVDRFADMTRTWRVMTLIGFVLTSFTIWDLMRRGLYTHVAMISGGSVGAMLLASALVQLRWRRLA